MSHYRKIDVRIWNDAKFQALSDTAKLCFFLLLTHPNMTALGAMRGTPEGLSAELKDFREAFPDAFREVLSKGMADYDAEARLIALPNFVRYNPPTSPNVVKAWVGALEYLPESPLKALVVQRVVAFAEGMSKGFRQAIPQALRDAMRYPLSTEHRDYLIQGGEFSELGTAGEGGGRPALAVVNGSMIGREDEL
ncbi:hypothetical protein ACTDI4_05550 [Mesorhizobium sp. PUT5]|uniref:hypothetical protein n=1 Tax=Mesorhizobium sp. PUT5 TaxID=3454629 RepID=UPI003FA4B456